MVVGFAVDRIFNGDGLFPPFSCCSICKEDLTKCHYDMKANTDQKPDAWVEGIGRLSV